MRRSNIFTWFILLSLLLSGCGRGASVPAPSPSAPSQTPPAERVASVEIYNRTGKIQKEEFYADPSHPETVSYTVEYSYTDSGRLSSVERKGGGLGENRPIETYFYSGENCTRKILYDENGGTKSVTYWTYDRKNKLTQEKVVSMLISENGYSYSGKAEEITDFNEDGTEKSRSYSAQGDYSRNEYEYGENGLLLVDRYFHSTDGETFRLFETWRFLYDSSGRLTRQEKADALGNVTYTESIEYDEAGNVLRDVTWPDAGLNEETILLAKTYEYDEGGRLTGIEELSAEGEKHTYYEYDSAGNQAIVTTLTFNPEGEMTGKNVLATEYDENGNAVKETVRNGSGKETVIFHYLYEYYTDGKIRTKTKFALEGE
jgi:YD repeat-containing protein